MKLNNRIIKVRVALQQSNIKKSGKNKFAGFEYFELSDFLPKLNELMLENELNDIFYIQNGEAILDIIFEEETNTYKIPFVMFDAPKNKAGAESMQQIQYLGALNTYYKRYLYLNAFGITDGEVIDSMDNTKHQNVDYTIRIKELIELTRTDELELLKYFKANAISEITDKARAIAMLEKKLK
jgi:hypothetical protein